MIKKLPDSSGDAGDAGLILGSGRSPGEGNGNPLQYSCLENPTDREAWQATVHGIAKESDTTEQLTKHKDKPRTFSPRIAVLNVTPASGPSTDPCSHTNPQGHH